MERGPSGSPMGRQNGQFPFDPAIPILEINPDDEPQQYKNNVRSVHCRIACNCKILKVT